MGRREKLFDVLHSPSHKPERSLSKRINPPVDKLTNVHSKINASAARFAKCGAMRERRRAAFFVRIGMRGKRLVEKILALSKIESIIGKFVSRLQNDCVAGTFTRPQLHNRTDICTRCRTPSRPSKLRIWGAGVRISSGATNRHFSARRELTAD